MRLAASLDTRRWCNISEVVDRFGSGLGGIPVERDGTDRKAVRESVAMLTAGEVLCVYPEGTRQHGPKIQPLQLGAAYFALRSGAPIIPIGIAGAEEILRTRSDPIPRFGPVTIVIGAPLRPEVRTSGVVPRERVDALTATLSDALQAVLDDAYERRDRTRHNPPAGRPD